MRETAPARASEVWQECDPDGRTDRLEQYWAEPEEKRRYWKSDVSYSFSMVQQLKTGNEIRTTLVCFLLQLALLFSGTKSWYSNLEILSLSSTFFLEEPVVKSAKLLENQKKSFYILLYILLSDNIRRITCRTSS